jgi:nucleotide-binding universal stress UspA family protein
MYERIVVGTDGSEGAGLAVDRASELAQLCGASLHLVIGCGATTVLWADATALGELGSGAAMAHSAAEMIAAWQARLGQQAEELRGKGLDVEVHVQNETGANAVLDVAEGIDADLIVVGNRGMSGARRVLGSVPNSVSHRAPCSVLIVSTN